MCTCDGLPFRWAVLQNARLAWRKPSSPTLLAPPCSLPQAALASWEALPEEQKQARIQQLQMTQALHKGRVVADYPQTDDQYADQRYPSTDDQYPAGAAGGSAYPSTDAQCEQGTAEAEAAGGSWYGGQQQAPENMTQEEYDEYCRWAAERGGLGAKSGQGRWWSRIIGSGEQAGMGLAQGHFVREVQDHSDVNFSQLQWELLVPYTLD